MKTWLLDFLILVVAALHIGFLILEMFLWEKPIGRKIFKMNEEFAKKSRVLAKNQGFYNGILAVGLLWSFFLPEPSAHYLRQFLLTAVAGAGIYGGITASPMIFFVQALPALIALIFLNI